MEELDDIFKDDLELEAVDNDDTNSLFVGSGEADDIFSSSSAEVTPEVGCLRKVPKMLGAFRVVIRDCSAGRCRIRLEPETQFSA